MKQISCLSIALVIFELFALYGSSFGGDVGGHASQANVDSITCGDDGQGIDITLNIPDHAEWSNAEAVIWRLVGPNADASCQPSFTTVPGKVYYASFNASTCAQSLEEIGDNLVYSFVVDAKPPGSDTTHKYDHAYLIQCLYNKEKTGIQASFLPLHSVTASDSADGMLVFTFTLHYSDNIPIDENTAIDLRTALYGKLTVSEAGFPSVNLDVHFKSVTAGTTNQAGGANDVTFITDGCAVNNAVDTPLCTNTDEDRFDFDAFRFSSQVTGNKVYIHVTAVVCVEDAGTTSTCETQCAACGGQPGKKRRQTIEESVATEYYLSAGPFTFADPEKEQKDTVVEEDHDEGSSVPAHFVAVGVVGGVVAVAIVCVAVIIVLRKRRQNATLAESRDGYEAAPINA